MAIDLEHDLAYENISFIIKEWEEQALRSQKREAYMALSNSARKRTELILDAGEQSFTKIQNDRARIKAIEETEDEELRASRGMNFIREGVHYDQDLLELFGGEENPVKNYIEECFGCNLRLKFDWQLQPLEFINPFSQFLDLATDAWDRFMARIDPFRILEDLCWALDHLKTLCPPDLILLLMALKMLLRKYMMNLFNIQFDWTLVLGPILKVIIDGVASLLEQLKAIMLAPVQCVLDALWTTNQLYKEVKALGNTAKAFGAYTKGVGDRLANGDPDVRQRGVGELLERLPVNGDVISRDFWWEGGSESDGFALEDPIVDGTTPPELETKEEEQERKGSIFSRPPPEVGQVRAKERSVFEGKERPSGTIPFAAFTIGHDTTLEAAIKNPGYGQATIFEKLIVPLQDFLRWVNDLVSNIIDAVKSLNSLIGASLSFNVDNLGITILLADLISLVMMIIRLLKTNPNISDWCKHLQENPELAEEAFRARYGSSVRVEADAASDSLIIRSGPDIVGKVATCVNERSSFDQNLISQWINDIESRGRS